MKPVFKLFANIIPVKGARRSALCDLQRGRIKLIPNAMFDMISDFNGQDIDSVVAAHPESHRNHIESYFQFLLEGEWGFITDEPDVFPDLDDAYLMPNKITNAVMDLNKSSNYDVSDVIRQLDDLGCLHLQIRAYHDLSPEDVEQLLETTVTSRLRSIELLVGGGESPDTDAWSALCRNHPRIHKLVLHGASEHRVIQTSETSHVMGVLITHPQRLESHEQCGVVDRTEFTPCISTFTEARHHNSCLHRKISVDSQGRIRNCPSMPESFGHVEDTALSEALEQDTFKKFWDMTKDEIEVCKDCEFRYVCTDCRAYVEKGDTSKPAKCGYDPYTATWREMNASGFMLV